MPTPTLAGCRAKHARASELIDRLLELVDEYLNDGPAAYRAHGRFDPDRCEFIVTGEVVRPMTDALMWAVLLGDVVHNLRSALDHLIWQLVRLDTGKDGSRDHQFPIASRGADYWSSQREKPGQRDRRLRGLSDRHKAMIDTLQPYRTIGLEPDKLEPLAVLAEFSNHDKHRLLHVILVAVDIRAGDAVVLMSNDDAGERLEATVEPFPDDGPGEVMRVKFSCPGPAPQVRARGDIPMAVGVEKANMRLSDLPVLSTRVGEIIEWFAADFPDRSDAADRGGGIAELSGPSREYR